jgi:hypothetical protein
MFKLIIIFILSFIVICSSIAQEKLVKSNGDTLSIKLIELNEKYVIYNKTVLVDERVFTTAISKFSTLIYSDGTIINLSSDNIVIIKNGEITSLKKSPYPTLYFKNGFWGPRVYSKEKNFSADNLMSLYDEIGNVEANQLFKKGRNLNILSNIIGIPSSLILGGMLGNTISGKKSNTTIYVASALGTIIALAISSKGINKIKNSVDSYNDSISTRFSVGENGIGLITEF